MSAAQDKIISAHCISPWHVQVPKETLALRLDGASIDRAWEGKRRGSDVREEDGMCNGFARRMVDKGPVAIVTSADISARGALATNGSF
jgi:hypothetical protein